jgi:hypothetical protein
MDSLETAINIVDKLCLDEPRLLPLRELLGPQLEPTSSFILAYRRSRISYGKKSVLLRAALGDPFYLRTPTPPVWAVTNLVAYLTRHPNKPLDFFATRFVREDLPAHIGRWAGKRRANPLDIISWLASQAFTPGSLFADIVSPCVRALTLTGENANYLLRHKQRLLLGRAYFVAAPPAIIARNAITLLSAVVTAPKARGKLQNRLPVDFTRYFGIKSHSLPELMMVADVIGLASSGIIKPDKLGRKADFLRLQSLCDALNDGGQDATRLFSYLCLMTPALSDQIMAEQSRSGNGMYFSGLLFNIPRILAGKRTSHADYRRYARYYLAMLDAERLDYFLLGHFEQVDPDFCQLLNNVIRLHGDRFQGIARRGLANALYHVWRQESLGHERHRILPSVARYLLGQPEHLPSRKTKAKTGGRRRSVELPPLRVLSELDELLDLPRR